MSNKTEFDNNKKPKKGYVIFAVLGFVFFIIYSISRGLFAAESAKEVFFILCDASFLPAGIFIVIGLSVYIFNDGFFDGFVYASRKLSYVFRNDAAEKIQNDPPFHEYKQSKHENSLSCKPALITGLAFLVLSSLFLLIYTQL